MRTTSSYKQSLVVVVVTVLVLAGVAVHQQQQEDQPAPSEDRTVDTTEEITLATSTSPITPTQLRIPAIDVEAAVESVGINESGNMGTPSDWRNVSWYQPGFAPGETGNAVFAGHLDWDENEAVFWDLNKLDLGDVVQVVGEGGRRLVYMVTSSEQYNYQVVDTTPIFGSSPVSQIKLITCDGEFIEGSETYQKRLIVTAQLITVDDESQLATSTETVRLGSK